MVVLSKQAGEFVALVVVNHKLGFNRRLHHRSRRRGGGGGGE